MVKQSLVGLIVRAVLFSGLSLLGWSAASGSRIPAEAAIATPTPVGLAVVRLNGSTVNKTPLPEAVREIDLRLGGGGYPGCLDIPEAPALDYKPDNLDLTAIAMITSCGWQADEIVKVSLMDPQGKITTSEVKAIPARQKKGVYEVDVFFQPGIDAPEGKYRFTLQGSSPRQESVALKAKVTFNRPKGARLYALPEDRFKPRFSALGGQQNLRLNGFLPGEPVRLLVYQVSGATNTFYGWQDFTTDPRGQLAIETDLPEIGKDGELNFYAYGRDTHFVSFERFTPDAFSISRQFDMDLYCPGAQSPRLNGRAAIRPAAGITRLAIHQQPGFGSRVTGQAAADSQMSIYGYPKCIDHAYWWKVLLTKPLLFGWAPESFLGKYQIEAVK